MKRNTSFLIGTFVVMFAMDSHIAAKQPEKLPTPFDPLPLDAQVAFDNGIDAAKVGDFAKALDLLQKAGSQAPDSALLFFNRGLTESKIPGRELRAIAWFGAYLDASPNITNAGAVKKTIAELQARSDANQVIFSKTLLDAARSSLSSPDVDKARVAAGLALLKMGDFAGVQSMINELTYEPHKTPLRLSLAEAQVRNGDTAGAREQIAQVQKSGEYMNFFDSLDSLAAVALAQSKVGDRQGTTLTLALAATIPARFNDPSGKSEALYKVARAQFAVGDHEGAKASITQALIAAQQDTSGLKLYRIVDGGILQAETGDLDGARETASALSGKDYERSQVLIAIAREQVKSGDAAGARKTVEETADFMHANALVALADEHLKAKQSDLALGLLSDALIASETQKWPLDRTITQCNIAFYQTKARDFEAARKTLQIAEKSKKKIPWNKGGGLTGAGGDQRQGAAAVSDQYRELEWVSRPWTKWTYHLSGVLSGSPFPDVAAYAKGLRNSYSAPDDVLRALVAATEAIAKERFLIDQMLGGGPPY